VPARWVISVGHGWPIAGIAANAKEFCAHGCHRARERPARTVPEEVLRPGGVGLTPVFLHFLKKLFVAKVARCDLSTVQVVVHTYVVHFCLGHSSEGSRRLPDRLTRIHAKPNVAIIGAGVIGLAIAWRLAGRGTQVAVFDKGGAGDGAGPSASSTTVAGLRRLLRRRRSHHPRPDKRKAPARGTRGKSARRK
jgi:FAD dependent oxidoreductase